MEIPYTVKPRPDTGLYNAKVGIWLFLASEVMLFGALFSSYILLRVGALPGTWPQGVLNIPIGTFNTAVLIASSVTVVMAWASLKMNQFSKFRLYMGLTVLCALTFVGVKSFEYGDKFSHYSVTLNDGKAMTGHIYVGGKKQYFLTKKQLADKNAPIEEIEFHADPVNVITGEGLDGKPSAAAGAGHEASGKAEAHAEGKDAHAEHPVMKIKATDIKWMSAFVPAHSTYFAIYFTMTGLHALHVIGGALVLAFFWLPGSAMWKTDPERLTNRIEVGGLFWHFVDLVWIFLFPVLYLL